MEQFDTPFGSQHEDLRPASCRSLDYFDNSTYNHFLPIAGDGFSHIHNQVMFNSGPGEPILPESMSDLMVVESKHSDISALEGWPGPLVLPSVPHVASFAGVTRPSSFADECNAHPAQVLTFPSYLNETSTLDLDQTLHRTGLSHPQSFGYMTREPFFSNELGFDNYQQHQAALNQETNIDLSLSKNTLEGLRPLLPASEQGPDLWEDNINLTSFGQSLGPVAQDLDLNYGCGWNFPQQSSIDNCSWLPLAISDSVLEMYGRRFSEPWGLGSSTFLNNTVASIRANDTYRQIQDYNIRSGGDGCQLAHVAACKLTETQGATRIAKELTDPGSALVQSNLLNHYPPEDTRQRVTRDLWPMLDTFTGYPTLHGALDVKYKRRNMGQETSQIPASENANQNLIAGKPQDDQGRNSQGWTAVNGTSGSERQPLHESPHAQTNGRKRKRTSKAGSDGGSPGKSAQVKPAGANVPTATSQPYPLEAHKSHRHRTAGFTQQPLSSSHNGLGITMPRKASTGSASSVDSVLAPSRDSALHSQIKYKDQAEHSESESDVDTDALGLLQRMAAADSDDDDEHVASSPAKIKAVPPTTPSQQHHGWQQPPRPTVGTHYTIYSPHVQPPGYAQPRPAPESFDPNAPLSAHEEAQLRDEGRFTKMEQSFLKDAIDEYCKRHHISVALANDYVCGKAREGNIPGDFWDEVCKALPQRTKNSIQRAAKRVFRNNQKKGPWTPEEEKALAEAYHKTPDQWAKICEEVPGRSAEQCRDRWRNYTQNGVKLTRGPWTDAEEAQFVEICKTMLGQARTERENQRRAGRTVAEKFEPIDHLNFTAISTLMNGSRSRLHCRNKWHKLKKRPDIEAAIEAVMKGDSVPATALPAQGPSVPSYLPPPLSNSQSTQQSHGPQPPYASSGVTTPAPSQPTSMLPVSSIAPAAPGTSPSHPAQPLSAVSNTMQTTSFHTFRPSPVQAFNQAQGASSPSTTSHISRPVSLPAPPHTYATSRQYATSPLSTAPPRALATAPPSLSTAGPAAHPAATATAPLPAPAPTSTLPSSSPPPTWAAHPPPVPRLFAPPPSSLAATSSALHHRATPGPKRGFPTAPIQSGAIPESKLANSPLSAVSTQPVTVANGSSTLKSNIPQTSLVTTSASSTHSSPQKPVLVPASSPGVAPPASITAASKVHTPATPSSVLPASNPPAFPPPNPAVATPQTNGNSTITSNSTSPESGSSPAAYEDKPDGRPVRKKQKTAKARGDI